MAKLSNSQIYQMKLWQKRSAEINRLINEKLVPNPHPKEGISLFEANKRATEIMGLFLNATMQEADAAATALIDELEAL